MHSWWSRLTGFDTFALGFMAMALMLWAVSALLPSSRLLQINAPKAVSVATAIVMALLIAVAIIGLK